MWAKLVTKAQARTCLMDPYLELCSTKMINFSPTHYQHFFTNLRHTIINSVFFAQKRILASRIWTRTIRIDGKDADHKNPLEYKEICSIKISAMWFCQGWKKAKALSRKFNYQKRLFFCCIGFNL